MTFRREAIPEISPVTQESLAGHQSYSLIEDIPALGLNGVTKYVGQRQIYDFHPNYDPPNVSSEGFGFCSGMLIRDREAGRYIFSHLEPFADEWHSRMNTGGQEPSRWKSPHDAVLIYGTLSSRQYEVESLMSGQFWGPATLRQVNVETGDTHWGMVFYGRLGELAIVRKKPDRSILRYQLFDSTSTSS